MVSEALSGHSDHASVLLQTRILEEKYQWAAAADKYAESLSNHCENSLTRADLEERNAYATYRLAMQARTNGEFRGCVNKAVAHYKQARQSLASLRHLTVPARLHRCETFLSFLNYWLSTNQTQKSRLLDEAWTHARSSLEGLAQSGANTEYLRTFNQVAIIAFMSFFFLPEADTRSRFLKHAIKLGEEAISRQENSNHPVDLAKAYVGVLYLMGILPGIPPDESQSVVNKTKRYWQEAKKLSESAALAESSPAAGGLDFEESTQGGIQTCLEALPYVLETRDSLQIGLLYDWLAQFEGLRSPAVEDPQEAAGFLDQALEHLKMARDCYDIISTMSPRSGMLWAEAPEPEYLVTMSWFETDISKRKAMLAKARRELPHLLSRAQESLYPDSMFDAHHVAGKVLLFSSKLEEDQETRTKQLKEALWHRRESIRLNNRTEGKSGIFTFLPLAYLAELEFELGKNTSDLLGAKRLIQQALQDEEKALSAFLSRSEILRESLRDYYFHWSAKMRSSLGRFYNELFELTHDESDLEKAAAALTEAATYQEAEQPSIAAENYWRAAQSYSTLNRHSAAVENTVKAMKFYETAAKTIPQLSQFYEAQAVYMNAWSKIEKATEHHGNQRYALARDLFYEAAELLKHSERWSHIAPNYRAIALLESAEDKSRRELEEEAILEFDAASRVFSESIIALQLRMKNWETDQEENHTAHHLLQAAKQRSEFCRARVEIERARLSSKKGRYHESRERYSQAIEILEPVVSSLPPGPDQNEARFVLNLSKAWQTVVRAEEEVKAPLFSQASEQFQQLKDLSTSQDLRLLMLGHSKYCKALEKATEFFETWKISEDVAATRYLESATGYYLQAGFQNFSDNAIATRRLLEGQLQLHFAVKERDPAKRAQIYSVAEKVFRSATLSLGEMGKVAKRDEVLRILERVRDEKDLAISLVGDLAGPVILSAHAIPSTRASVQSPASVEIVDNAYVRANLAVSPSNPKIGQQVSLKIEFANAGTGPAQLVKVERAIPKGFDLVQNPRGLTIEDNRHILLQGRRLDPLKTDQIDLILEPRVEGPIAMTPRVLYLDENGRNRFHEPQPFEIIVENNALRGHDVVAAHESLYSPILKFLTDSFRQDYLARRLSMEHAGWRGLPEIVGKLKIPRSQVYGDARYGHVFGGPLERLIRNGSVEFRIFPEQRGRGGRITKVRANYDMERVKKIIHSA